MRIAAVPPLRYLGLDARILSNGNGRARSGNPLNDH